MPKKGSMSGRNFLRGTVAGAATVGLSSAIFSPEEILAETTGASPVAQNLISQCPYCGVGCGTIIKADKTGRILGVVPDKQHPTNKGVQCIKGLNADEPTYVDRLNKVLVRKDMSDPLKGYESATKGGFDDDMFEEVSFDLISNMRNNLHSFTQIIAFSFFGDYIMVDTSGGNIICLRC